jgi:myo-inositol-1(or 4)-monophosphatase
VTDQGDRVTPCELSVIATEIAHLAGDFATEMVGGEGARARLRAGAGRKSSATDLVSQADRATEALIVRELRQRRPHDGILAEEGAANHSESGLTWVVDPIDGTTNFLYGNGSYAISIGVRSEELTLAGCVYDPVRRESFVAANQAGATLNGEPLTTAHTAPPLSEALVGTGFHYLAERRREQAELLTHLLPRVRDIRRQGAASVDLCWVAAGRLDAYYECGLMPWDLCAGLLIAEEAGYLSARIDLGSLLDDTVLVTHRDLRTPMVELLRRGAPHAR